jgi:hypothetical protein
LPVWRQRNAVGIAELRCRRRSAVAGKSRDTGAGQRRQPARPGLDLPNHMIVALGDVQVTCRIERELVRHVQRSGRGRIAVTGIGPLAVPRDVGDAMRLQIEAPDSLVVEIAEIERTVRADRQAERIVHLCV